MSQEYLPLVLAVDDEPNNLALIERMLRNTCQVISVTNGCDALETLHHAPFDLVLLDIMLPDLDGINVLEVIRRQPDTADVPVILISVLSDLQTIDRGYEAGANDYLTKPLDVGMALARVHTQIAQR